MDNIDVIKNLSKFLSKNLKDKNVKQSELLELISQFNGFKDWNSFSGTEKNNKYNPNNNNWTKLNYVHIDNGGYSFSYNSKLQKLYIETSFFGYSINCHYFNITKKDLKNLYFHLKKPLLDENENAFSYSGDVWKIEDGNLIFKDNNNEVLLGTITKKITRAFKIMSSSTLEEILEGIDIEKWEEYKKTDEFKDWESMKPKGKEII